LTASRRRCCLCVFLFNREEVRKGQIAHLNGDASDNDFGNLVWLCLDHHDEYDGRTSQSKGFTRSEVRTYRDQLYERFRSPVAGLTELTSNSLVRNPDRSVTIWIGPKLPEGAPASNWLPTPSNEYYESIYPTSMAPDGFLTEIRPLFRIYIPQPGDQPPSILPPPGGALGATYVFPKLRQVR